MAGTPDIDSLITTGNRLAHALATAIARLDTTQRTARHVDGRVIGLGIRALTAWAKAIGGVAARKAGARSGPRGQKAP